MDNQYILPFVLVLVYCSLTTTFSIGSDDTQHAVQSGQEVVNPLEKRMYPLSLSGDLRSLARMLYSQKKRRRVDNLAMIRKKLYELGKRSDETVPRDDEEEDDKHAMPYVNMNTRPHSEAEDQTGSDVGLSNDNEFGKRGQRLSINGALSSLSGMLAASGRRRLQEEMALNQQRLMNLGRK